MRVPTCNPNETRMRRWWRVAFVASALTLSAGALQAASLKADLVKAVAEQQRLMMSTVSAMPESSFDSRPTPEQRTFRDAVLHVAGANSFLIGFTGAKADGPAVEMAKFQTTFGLSAKSKDEVLAALAAGYDHLAAAVKEFDDEAMLEEVQGPPWVGKATRATIFHYILSHNHNIYGQMVVYLRLEGVTPPASG